MKHLFCQSKSVLLVITLMLGVLSESVLNAQEELPVFQIAHLCDPQLGFGVNGNGYEDDLARLKKAVLRVNELMPDMVVVAGDMVNDVNNDEAAAAFQEAMALLKMPVVPTPGNHDLPDPVTADGLQRYRSRYGEDFRVIECKGRCLVSANSQLWREAPGEEIVRHERLLRDALQKAKTKKQPVIMLTHVPPFVATVDEADEYFNLPQAKREEILRLCDEHGVFLWLAGHTHKTARRSYQRITLLNGETTSRNFDGHPPGFRLLTIHSDQSFDWDFISCEPD